VSDAQWCTARELLPESERLGRNASSLRRILNAVNYRWSTGCSWRMLPHDFPPWQTVYRHFRKWQDDRLLPAIRDIVLQRRVRDAERRSVR
jgi:transposase